MSERIGGVEVCFDVGATGSLAGVAEARMDTGIDWRGSPPDSGVEC